MKQTYGVLDTLGGRRIILASAATVAIINMSIFAVFSRWQVIGGHMDIIRIHSFVRRRETRRGLFILGVGLAVLGIALTVAPLYAATTRVEIISFNYTPQTVTVAFGDTVTWTNRDGVGHTATGIDGQPFAFDTGVLGTNESGSVRFDTSGTFEYYCRVHPGMRGIVVVEAAQFTESVYLPMVLR